MYSIHPPIYDVPVCKAFFERKAALNQKDFPPRYEVEIQLEDGTVQTCFDVQPHQVYTTQLYFRYMYLILQLLHPKTGRLIVTVIVTDTNLIVTDTHKSYCHRHKSYCHRH